MKQTILHHRKPGSRSQTGAALAISLIMLLLLTIIGVTAMQSTTLQERMAGNARELNDAFQIAEAGLIDGERYLNQVTIGPFSSTANTDGLYEAKSILLPTDQEWWDITATWTAAGSDAGTLTGARYIVEQLPALATGGSLEAGTPGVLQYYRITAQGTGPANTAVVMLQSTFKR